MHQLHLIFYQKPSLIIKIRAFFLLKIFYTVTKIKKKKIVDKKLHYLHKKLTKLSCMKSYFRFENFKNIQ